MVSTLRLSGIKTLMALGLFALSFSSFSQFDTQFWMPPIWDIGTSGHNQPSELFITTPYPTTVNVHIETPDGISFVLDTTVISGNPLQVVLTTDFGQTTTPNQIETNSGLIVTSDAPIQCVHKLSAQFNQTLVTLKGPNGLGTDFYCGSQTFNQNLNYNPNEYHFISVMALHDDTQISFDTPFDMYQSGPGDLPNPYVITLDQYETYLIHGNNPIEHVAGSHVTSDKNITVISGSTHTRVGSSTNADGGTDQLVPVDLMGDEFVIIKGQNSDPTDYAIVVATEDNTDVYIDGGGSPVANIDAGEYYNYFLSGSWGAPHYISTSKVSYVYHVTGASNNDEVGMSAIPQIQCTGSRYIEFSKFTVNTSNQILNVIAPADAEPTLELNNIPYSSVPGAVSSPVPGLPGWTAVSFPNSSLDPNNIITSDGFFHAGFLTGTGSSTGTYGFLSGFDDAFEFLDPFNGLPTTVYLLDTLCPGESIDHCIQVFSCAFDHNIVGFEGNEGTVVITPPTSPYDTCFSYTAPFTFTGLDTVTFTIDNVFGFDGDIDIVFHIVDPDTPIDAGPVQELCSETTGTLSAVDPDPFVNGYWTVLAGGSTIVDSNSPTTSVTNLALGTNTFLWTQDYGCSSNFDITQIIVYDGTAPAADAGGDITLCTDNNSTNMGANDPLFTATGTWEITAGNATIWDINDPNALVTNLGIGINIFEWNIDNGPCPGGATVDEMIISVYDHTHPDADAGTDQEYCSDAFVQADVVGNTAIIPAIGQWSLVSGTGTIDDPLSPSTFITGCGLGENVFEWQIDNGPCGILTDTISIFIYDSNQASPNAGTDTEYCTEIIGHTMNATAIPFPASGLWTLVSGAGVIVDPSDPTTDLTNLGIGENIFQWTLDNGPCGNTGEFDQVSITVYDATHPVADAGADQEFCVTDFSITSLEANMPTLPASALWTVTSGSGDFADDTDPLTTVTGLTPGSNIFQWTIDNGPCALPSIDFVEIIIYTTDQDPADAGPDVEFCTPTSTYTMQAIDLPFPSSGVWTLESGTGTISDINDPNAEIAGLGIGENIYRWTVDNGPCPSGTNFDEVSIFIYDENLEEASAGPDQEMCSSLAIPVDATMAANTPIFPATGTWTTIQGGGNIADVNDPTTLITLLPVGENIFEWTYDNGPCDPTITSDQVSIFVYPVNQNAADAGPDQETCSDGGPSTLAASSATFPASGEWTLVSGSASFVDATDPITDVSGLSVGENVLEWTISNGPCNPTETTDTMTITVYDETQTVADAGTDQEMCSDAGTIDLSANNASFPASGLWTVVSGSGTFLSDTNPSTTVSGLSVGENIFEWTVVNGPCSPAISSDQVSVFVYDENAPLADAGDDQDICSLSPSTSMDANSPIFPATGFWELVSGTGTIVDVNDPNTTINALAIGENVFRWNIDNAPCIPATSQDLVSIFVFDDTAPTSDAGADQEYCTPVASTTLEGNSAIFPATGSWTLVSGTGNIVAPTNPNTLVTGLAIGENIFEWTINSGVCPDAITTDQVSIIIFNENQELANAGADQNFCTPVTTTNLAGNTADFPANGAWALVSGTGTITDATDPNTGITGLTIGENIFEWTVFNGPCSPATSSDQVSVFIYDDTAADADAGSDQELCTPTTSTNLSANSAVFPASGEWTLISGSGSITDPNDPSTSVTGLAIGENVFQWSIDNLTCSGGLTTDEVSIFVFFDGQAAADAGGDQDICTPQSTVTMDGNAVTFPGLGTWTLISGSGSITDPNDPQTGITGLTVGISVFEWTVDNGPCGAPTSDQVSILVFDGSAAAADAGVDQELCSPSPSTTMAANSAVVPAQGTWTLVSGSGTIADANDPNTGITALGIGVNTFQWMLDYSVCGSTSDLINIIVYDSTVPASDAGADQEFCSPVSTATMAATGINPPGFGTWTLVSGTGVIADENNPNTGITGLTIGENIFQWEVYNGSCLSGPSTQDLVSIFIFDMDLPFAEAGADQEFCSPTSTATMTATAAPFPASGAWVLVSGSGVITDPSDPTTGITGLAIGENIFEWTVSNGPCTPATTNDQMSIFIYDDTAADADAGLDQDLCTPTTSTTLAGNAPVAPATGEWILISGSGSITDPSDPNSGVTGLGVGENVFEWSIDNLTCSNGLTSDQMSIFVYFDGQLDADAGADQDICTPQTSTFLEGNSVTFPATGEWTLVSGFGTIVDSSDPTTEVTGLAIGVNVFQWEIDNVPCAAGITSDQVSITVFDGGAPQPSAGEDQELCSPTSTTFMTADAAVLPGEGTWSLISGSGSITDVNDPLTEITGLAIGVNVFEWSLDYSTCGTQTDEVSIIVYDSTVPAANAGVDQEFCAPTNSSTMAADAIASPGYGTWSLFSGSGTFDDVNDPASAVSNLTIGENIFVWEVYNGSCLVAPLTTDTMSIFIYDNLQANADAGPDQIFCSPVSSTTLAGNDADFPASGVWTLVSGSGTITDSNDPLTDVTAMSIGENIFEWTVDNGPCGVSTSDQVSIFIYDDNAADADAGPDQELCTPTISTLMAANSPVAPATGLWELISGSGVIASPSNPLTSISGLAVGENIFEWTIDNDDCSNGMTSDLVSIFVFDTNQADTDAGPDQDLCTPVTATTLVGNALTFPATGVWTLVSGTGDITTPTGASTTVTGLGIGINVFEWTISNGPCIPNTSSDQVIISVFDGNAAPVYAGADQELCTPTTTTFMTADAAVNPGIGTWTLISGTGNITDPNDPLTEITGLTLGVNVFEWSVDYSTCGTQTDQVTITIYDSTVPASNAGADQDLCAPVSSTTMTADGIIAPGFGTWSLFSGNGTIIDLNDPNTTIDNLTIGENIFVWEVYNGPCLLAPLTTDTVSIFIFDNLQESADAGEDQDICTPQTSTFLEGNTADFPAIGTWTLVSGGGTIVNPNDPNTEVTDMPVGENVFEWNIVNGSCPGGDTTDEVSIFIFNENQLDANAGPDQDFCTPFSSLNLDGNAITFPAEGTWELLNGSGTIADPNDPNTLVTNLDVGENIFEWTVDNGPCGGITTDIVSIFIYNQFNEDANAGLDQELCTPDTTTNLTGNSPIFPASGEWTLISGTGNIDNPSDGNTLITGLTVGESVFVWTVDNGPCANGITSDTVSVFIFDDMAPLAFAGDDQEFCTPISSTLLNADTPIFPGAGTWTLVSGTGTIVSPTDPNSQVTDLEVGENIFEWEVYNGPCNLSGSIDQVSIFIFDESQDIADAGPDQDLCSPQFSTSLAANSVIFPATGTWTLIQGTGILSNANDPTTFVTGLSVGDNIFEWTIENGPCNESITTDTVTISVFDNELDDADAGEDQEFCLPDNFATLDGSDLVIPATGVWTQIQGGGNILDPTSDITAVTSLPVGENIFVWSVDNGPCGSSADTVSVFVFDPDAAIADAGPNQDFCTPISTTSMDANTPADPGVGTWALVVGDGTITDVNDPVTDISGLTIGENIFSWTIYNGPCADPTVDFVSIFIFDENAPAADAGPDLEICLPLDSINMNGNAAVFPASGSWSIINGTGTIVDVNDENALITDLELGTNTFVWSIDNNPCANGITSDTVNVFVFENDADLANAGIDQEFCSPTATTVLDADDLEDPNTGTWTLVSGTGLFGDATDPNTIVSGMTVGINEYQWSVYNGPCADSLSTDIVQVLIFDETQEVADAGLDQELCLPINSTLMNGNALISPATGMWTLVSGSGTIVSPTDPNTQIIDLALGVNVFEWTTDNGPCDNAITSDQVTILVFEEDADVAYAGADIEICTPEDCVTLGAATPSIPTTGTWTWIQGSGTISDINDPNADVCALTVGHYILQWTIYNGPCANNNSFDFVDIYVYDANAEPAYAGEDQEMCWPEDATVLEADTALFPAEGTWEFVNGSGALSDINDPAADLTDMSIGITELTWTVYNGPCADPTIDTVMISIFNPDSPDAYAGEDQHFCSPFTGTTMDANSPLPPATGTWSLVSGAATITNNTLPNTTVFDLGFGENILVWSIYNGVCDNGLTTDTVSLFLNDVSVANAFAGPDMQFCGALDSLQMDGSETIGNTAVGTWSILEGGGDFFNVNNEHTYVFDIPTGMNTYLWTVDNDECGISTDSVNILIFDPAIDTAFAGISQVICEDDFSPFNLNGNEFEYPATGYWNIIEGPIEIEDPTDPTSLILDLGSIDVPLTDVLSTLTWTIDNGVCGMSTDSVSFILEDCLTIVIPDAFSPNGDGINDLFEIPNLFKYPNNSIKIFNRWGSLVFEAAPYKEDWDGRSQHGMTLGDELPVSTYYYVLDLGDGSEGLPGYIYLKR